MASHSVDLHVGRRLRYRRTMLGVSQEDLGKQVGVTFQQIQKYEKGLNRIGASRLYEFSQILEVNVSFFFEEMATENTENNDNLVVSSKNEESCFEHEKLSNKEMLSLMRAYSAIEDKEVRKKINDLVKSLSEVAEIA